MGTLIYGKERLERHLQTTQSKWIFLASDCSENTKKMWLNKSASNGSKLIQFKKTTKKILAQRLGKNELSAVSTSNKDILKGIRNYLENN